MEYHYSHACGGMPAHAALSCLQGLADGRGGQALTLLEVVELLLWLPWHLHPKGWTSSFPWPLADQQSLLLWAPEHVVLHLNHTDTHMFSMFEWVGPSRGDMGVDWAQHGSPPLAGLKRGSLA